MHLIEIINTLIKRSEGIFIVCDIHLSELKVRYHPNLSKFRHIHDGFEAECQMCNKQFTPLNFDKNPEHFNIAVTLENGEYQDGWSGAARIGHIQYLIDNNGKIYNSHEALSQRKVRTIHIEAGFELHIEAPE